MKSIRQELTTRLLAGSAILLLIGSLLLCLLVRSILQEGFDDALLAKAQTMATLTTREGQLIESELNSDIMPEFDDDENPEFFQLRFQDGSLINESESMEDLESEFPTLGTKNIVFGNIGLEDDDPGRYILLRTRPILEEPDEEEEEEAADEEDVIFEIPDNVDADTATVTIFLARSRESLDQMLLLIYSSVGGIVLLTLTGMVWVVRSSIQRGLSPVESINSQIDEIDPETMGEPVHLESPPSELQTIIQALNQLLDRMNQVITRERRFTSDVAHELRTPVSELRTACEVGGLTPEDEETTKLFFEDINEIALQMEKVVSNLLSLSRWEQDEVQIEKEEVELRALVENCWEHFSSDAESKQIELDCRIDPGTQLETDREKFEMIVQNLLENAIAYSIPGSRIRCLVEPGNPSIQLMFENQPTNLCKEDLDHLFDRFWRKEKARSEVNHSGLGLSIVKALADMLHIEIHPEIIDEQWFRMRLKISI